MYIVKPIIEMTPIMYTRTWGVYNNPPKDEKYIRYKNNIEDVNLIVICHSEIIAQKIAELLNIDEWMEENNN